MDGTEFMFTVILWKPTCRQELLQRAFHQQSVEIINHKPGFLTSLAEAMKVRVTVFCGIATVAD